MENEVIYLFNNTNINDLYMLCFDHIEGYVIFPKNKMDPDGLCVMV